MSISIGSHKLTTDEVQVLDAVCSYLRKNGHDSWLTTATSPKGDGVEIAVTDIFRVRNNQDNARRTVERLGQLGVLAACEIQLDRGMLKSVPWEQLKKSNTPA